MDAPVEIRLTRREHAVLLRWAGDKADEYRAFQARVILRAAEDRALTNAELAGEFGLERHTVGRWRHRFATLRLAGLGRITNPPSAEPPDEKI